MEIQREELEVDILIVGAGPAGLACGYHLAKQWNKENGELPEVVIIEKSPTVGMHLLSGAVLDPRPMAEMMPDFLEQGMPVEAKTGKESFLFLTEKGQLKSPLVPPGMHNKGNYIISLYKFAIWLAEKVEELGVNIFTGTGGAELLIEDGRVVGVQTVDMGREKDGSPADNFEPGSLIKAKVTVLSEGVRGSLTEQAYEKLGIGEGKLPHSFLTGIKEIWKVPAGRMKDGEVVHTFGWPQPNDEFGGGFIYSMAENKVAVGFCAALASSNPTNDPHMQFQRFKTHPYVKKLLDGGEILRYGAKAIAEGGYYALPKFHHSGMLVIGESAGLLNAQRLKGVHLAIKSGMMAAETIQECHSKKDFTETALSSYSTRFEKSWACKELYSVRNFHAGFEGGLWAGIFHAGIQFLTGGRGLFDRRVTRPDHEHYRKLSESSGGGASEKQSVAFDGKRTFDKLSDVYHSGTAHEERQPSHLRIADFDICNTKCTVEYGNPCQHFCPASVYNMVDDESNPGKKKLELSPSNCVHCKTCDIADPYGIITWVVPEGGGPNYVDM